MPLKMREPGMHSKKTGRKKLVVSGLWTSMCFAYTALRALKEGYEVYGLINAAGDSTPEAHKYGIKRMLQVGVIPITFEHWYRNGCMTGTIQRRASLSKKYILSMEL
jgi:hypothetical protein